MHILGWHPVYFPLSGHLGPPFPHFYPSFNPLFKWKVIIVSMEDVCAPSVNSTPFIGWFSFCSCPSRLDEFMIGPIRHTE